MAIQELRHVSSSFGLPEQLVSDNGPYQVTPHATTNVAPSALFLNRHVQTRFDLLHPDVEENIAFKQA